MRSFGTHGRVRPKQHYIVSRSAGKKQFAAYMKLETAVEGYYVVFDHRQNPEAQVETEEVDGVEIRSYVIPVLQRPPSAV